MKRGIIKGLVCPSCGGNLDLKSFIEESGEVKEGLLECSCGQWYPIIGFVPRLLLEEYRKDYSEFLDEYGLKHLKGKKSVVRRSDSAKTQVQRSFSVKWTSQPLWGINGETQSFMREWVLDKYGWGDLEGFRGAVGEKRRILDAGAGLGREVANFCEVCKKGEVFGVDVGELVDTAYFNTREYPHAHIIQADLMKLPFKRASFDFIFSEGVLHHTPDTKRAFECLLDFLAPEGEIAIYVYKKKGPIREFCDDYLRQFTTKLSPEECWEFSKKMTKFGKALSDLDIEFEIPEDLPELEIQSGKYNLQRFFYYHIFKCFWNDRFTFDENNLINFDWYHPTLAFRHNFKEVRQWFLDNSLEIAFAKIEESGIAMRGRKAGRYKLRE
jgi:SAM-dependent methyltransferase